RGERAGAAEGFLFKGTTSWATGAGAPGGSDLFTDKEAGLSGTTPSRKRRRIPRRAERCAQKRKSKKKGLDYSAHFLAALRPPERALPATSRVNAADLFREWRILDRGGGACKAHAQLNPLAGGPARGT
ncbi:MAG: hypothetical protein MK097_18495, partial [Dechloromonas sp.]|nr:hypothetical protein [Dechloromonas sp.]